MAKAKLTFEAGDREGEKVKIPLDGPLLIGGKEGERLDLLEESAAYRHAKIVAKGDKYVLEDLGSDSGTLLNGESVAISRLTEGDVIQIGETRLVFHEAKVFAAPAGAADGKPVVAPKIKLDRPPPKEMPHFDRPEAKVVKVKLHSTKKRAWEHDDSEKDEEKPEKES